MSICRVRFRNTSNALMLQLVGTFVNIIVNRNFTAGEVSKKISSQRP